MNKVMLSLLCLLAVGCRTTESKPGYCTFKSQWYVQAYLMLRDIDMLPYSIEDRVVYLEFDGERVSSEPNERPVIFRQYAEKYNDLSWYGCQGVPIENPALANELTRVSIVSDADYDELHPAGTPLDDIVRLSWSSFYPFVENGYTGDRVVSYDKTLDELEPEELILVALSAGPVELRFVTAPTEEQVHTVTLTITDDNGSTFIKMKKLWFDDPSKWVN